MTWKEGEWVELLVVQTYIIGSEIVFLVSHLHFYSFFHLTTSIDIALAI